MVSTNTSSLSKWRVEYKEMTKYKNTQSFGISLPNDIIEHIDFLRGDITRSRYILRLIETGLDITKKMDKKK